MKRTLILSLALLTPTAFKAVEPATLIALSGPVTYVLWNDCSDAPRRITTCALLSIAFAATAKMCASGLVTMCANSDQPASLTNFAQYVALASGTFIAGGLACVGAEGCIREFLRNTNQKK